MGCLLSVGTGAWKKEQNCVSQIEYPQKNYKAYTSAGPRLLLDPKSAIMWVLGEKKKIFFYCRLNLCPAQTLKKWFHVIAVTFFLRAESFLLSSPV